MRGIVRAINRPLDRQTDRQTDYRSPVINSLNVLMSVTVEIFLTSGFHNCSVKRLGSFQSPIIYTNYSMYQ